MSIGVNLDRRVNLSPHAALKRRAEGDILVLPERAIRLGGSGGQILRLCDGEHTGHELIATMRDRYPEDSQIDEEVASFLSEMSRLGGIVVEGTSATVDGEHSS